MIETKDDLVVEGFRMLIFLGALLAVALACFITWNVPWAAFGPLIIIAYLVFMYYKDFKRVMKKKEK
ncbi:hypothetical protein KKG83_00040 [Candidatus Micrarchaeota archaeon]|nr:hypothetical protein [Candidatus Micrarchaeota archaeon]MBU2475841.1 hypothetical protein [Candidatus Micrarchaeota archaeon]